METGNCLASFNGTTLGYDADGNLTSKTKTGFTQTLTWNTRGQLTQVVTNGVTTTFGYDGFGRRVRKTTGTSTTRYLWDGDDLLMELDGVGTPVREYSHYPGVDNPFAVRRSSDGAVFYYAEELPGHVAGLINTADQVVNTYTYDPWGQPLGTTEQVPQPLRYGAREYDGETGFYYVRARYYDAQLGRFISEDPIGMKGGINPFVYVGNDPVNGRDPNGLCELKQEVWFGYFYADGTFEPVRKIGEFCLGSDGGSGGAWDPAQPQSPDPQRPACTAEALNLIGNAGLDLLTFWGAGVGIRLLGTGFAEVGFGALVKGAAVSTVRGTFTHGSVVAAGRVGSAYITSGLVEAGVGSGLLVPQLIAEANLSSIGAGAGSAGRLGLKDFIPGYGTYSAYQAYRECRGWK